jgi:hypothetical protein
MLHYFMAQYVCCLMGLKHFVWAKSYWPWAEIPVSSKNGMKYGTIPAQNGLPEIWTKNISSVSDSVSVKSFPFPSHSRFFWIIRKRSGEKQKWYRTGWDFPSRFHPYSEAGSEDASHVRCSMLRVAFQRLELSFHFRVSNAPSPTLTNKIY